MSCPTPGVGGMAPNLARLELRGIAIFAKNLTEDPADLPEGGLAPCSLEHGLHEVAAGGAHAVERRLHGGTIPPGAQLGHGCPLRPLRTVVDLQRRDRCGGRGTGG